MTRNAVVVAILAGITLHAGVFHLRLYFKVHERLRADLYFGITALMIAFYDFCCVGLYDSQNPSQGMFWQRLQVASISTACLSFLYFISAYAQSPLPKIMRLVGWLFPLFGIVTLVERRGLMLTNQLDVKRFELPLLGSVTYWEVALGPLYDALAICSVFVALYAFWAAVQVRRAGDRRRARNIGLALAVFALGGLNDTLISEHVMHSPYLIEFAWTAIVVLAGYSLSNELLAAALAKQALAEGKARLAHAERLESVGALAGGVAHDLNNMLMPVIGYGHMAQGLTKSGSRERTYMDNLVAAAERASALTRHLLAFARKQVLEVKPLNLADSIKQLEPLLRRLLPEGIRLEIRVAPEIPMIEADLGQLEQVWMNLAANARDAMPDGGSLSFDVSSDRTRADGKPGVQVVVRDTGVGMSSTVLDRAFDPFFSTKARGEGTGLGLSIVHGIVEQHGGKISLGSTPGRGTTLKICFPATGR